MASRCRRRTLCSAFARIHQQAPPCHRISKSIAISRQLQRQTAPQAAASRCAARRVTLQLRCTPRAIQCLCAHSPAGAALPSHKRGHCHFKAVATPDRCAGSGITMRGATRNAPIALHAAHTRAARHIPMPARCLEHGVRYSAHAARHCARRATCTQSKRLRCGTSGMSFRPPTHKRRRTASAAMRRQFHIYQIIRLTTLCISAGQTRPSLLTRSPACAARRAPHPGRLSACGISPARRLPGQPR